VNQYLWDDKGVILKAAWGMLRPTRDDKKHAALCALRLVEALGDGVRVGVANGVAFTGLVGAEGMRLGMVMFGAESVTLAARLMMAARRGTALVSANVRASTVGRCRLTVSKPELKARLVSVISA
jgi:class 3 adenylate cyclase